MVKIVDDDWMRMMCAMVSKVRVTGWQVRMIVGQNRLILRCPDAQDCDQSDCADCSKDQGRNAEASTRTNPACQRIGH